MAKAPKAGEKDATGKPAGSGRKVIITCAITGAIHTPSMSPYLPVTHQQIADEAIAAISHGLRPIMIT